MIDPPRLMAATVAIYGEEEARRTYGEVLPVPAARVIETGEGARISLGNRRLDFLEKLFAVRTLTADPREVLAGLWRWLTQADGIWDRTLVAINGNIYYGLWYPIVVAALTFVIGLIFIPETKDRPLHHDAGAPDYPG